MSVISRCTVIRDGSPVLLCIEMSTITGGWIGLELGTVGDVCSTGNKQGKWNILVSGENWVFCRYIPPGFGRLSSTLCFDCQH